MSSFQTFRAVVVPALALSALAVPAFAQRQPPTQAVTVKQIKTDIHWAEGDGGNSGIVIGSSGVFIVDVKSTAAGAQQVLDAVAKLTPKPITHVFITHSDRDHWGGLGVIPENVTVVAHAIEKREQEAIIAAGEAPNRRLPTRVVAGNKETMTVDGIRLELLHWEPAHTSGDLIVYLPDQRVVFTGDVTSAGARPDPTVHDEKGGTTLGWINTVKGILSLDADVFVPGHGDVQTRAFLQQRLALTEERRNRIGALVKEGKSLAEVKAALGGDPSPPSGNATFVEIAYREFSKK